MGAAVAHPISPELVLVCPELREHALTLLPAVDPEELFAVEPRPAAAPAPRPVPRPSPSGRSSRSSNPSRSQSPSAAPRSRSRSSPT